jgi:CheY-like chemotaxis protein
VVDDEADSREALAELLLNEGYAIVCAENGRRALHCLTGMTPALIILDLMMPVMSGWEFLAQQKRDDTVRSVPVVVVTGSRLVRAMLKRRLSSISPSISAPL